MLQPLTTIMQTAHVNAPAVIPGLSKGLNSHWNKMRTFCYAVNESGWNRD